jgi:hypothetical protein
MHGGQLDQGAGRKRRKRIEIQDERNVEVKISAIERIWPSPCLTGRPLAHGMVVWRIHAERAFNPFGRTLEILFSPLQHERALS